MIDQEGIKIELKIADYAARVMLVSVTGYVDQANCHLLQKTIDKCLDDKYYRLVFNLQKLVYMSSAGWGVLIGEIKRFRENGGDIKLANMGPEIYEIYQMLEFYHIISEYPSAEDAFKSFNAKTPDESEVPLVQETPVEDETEEDEPAEEIAPEKEIFEPRLLIPRREAPVVEEPLPGEEKVSQEETASEEKILPKIENAARELFGNKEISEEKIAPYQKNSEEQKSSMKEPVKEKPVEPRKTSKPPRVAAEEIHAAEDEAEEPESGTGNSAEAVYYPENNHSESPSEPEGISDENQEVVMEDEINVNIEGILADEGISTSGAGKSNANYIEFDPEKYKRKIDTKVMPVPDKIRDIVARNPELAPAEIRKMLGHPDYGAVKIGYFKFKSMLKALDLDTKQKRYRFHRSS